MEIIQLVRNASKGKTAKLAIGVIALMVFITLIMYLFTTSISDVAKQHLTAIQRDNLEKAYSMTSSDFQAHTSFAQFKAFVDGYPILKNYTRVRFSQKRIDDGSGYLYGKLEDKDSVKDSIEFQFIKNSGEWKIEALRLAPASSEDDEPVSDASGASIHNVFINDMANEEGYTEQGKSSITKTAPVIYVTVQVIAPTTGINVSATLMNISSGSKIGPSGGEITKAGNVLKAFSFTRDKQLWPTGKYQIEISLSTGASKVVRFLVK